jgi:hypothetical protein
MGPEPGAAGVPALLPLLPEANGLLKLLPDVAPAVLAPPKLKLKPPEPDPEPVFDDGPPKPTGPALAVLPFCAGADDAPNMLVAGAVGWLLAKLNMGVESPPVPPPLNNFFFAGDGSSCFMGLPNRLPEALAPAAAAAGDFGAPNIGFDAAADGAALLVLLPPKSKLGFGASVFAAVESVVAPDVAPKSGCCG